MCQKVKKKRGYTIFVRTLRFFLNKIFLNFRLRETCVVTVETSKQQLPLAATFCFFGQVNKFKHNCLNYYKAKISIYFLRDWRYLTIKVGDCFHYASLGLFGWYSYFHHDLLYNCNSFHNARISFSIFTSKYMLI
jgi:hypothetical protein